MYIITFTSEESMDSKMSLYSGWANLTEGDTITSKYKHTTQDIWWFSKDDVVNPNYVNGASSQIQEDIDDTISPPDILEKTQQELIDEGFLLKLIMP